MIATQFVVAMETGHDAQAQVRLHNHAAGRWVREYIPEKKKKKKKKKKYYYSFNTLPDRPRGGRLDLFPSTKVNNMLEKILK